MANIDEASGKRYKATVSGERFYIAVFPDTKELFMSGASLTGEHELICRSISKLWMHEGIEICLEQLSKVSQYPNDLFAVLHSILSEAEK